MSIPQLLHVTTVAGNQIAINKTHILSIAAPIGELWVMVTSINGDNIQLHPETDYAQTVESWVSC